MYDGFGTVFEQDDDDVMEPGVRDCGKRFGGALKRGVFETDVEGVGSCRCFFVEEVREVVDEDVGDDGCEEFGWEMDGGLRGHVGCDEIALEPGLH